MRYKWKPTRAQKEEYKRKLEEKSKLNIFTTQYPIRNGCKVKFYSMSKGEVIEGEVINHTYGKIKNQHTFTILSNNEKILVKGRNLYPNILSHIRGSESLKLEK